MLFHPLQINGTSIISSPFFNITITDVVIAISAVIALAFGIYTAHKFQSRQAETADKQYQLTALLEIFKMMNADEQKQLRATLYDGHNRKISYDRYYHRQAFEKLRSVLDMVGVLYHQNAVPREALLEMYWHVIIHCWVCLEQYIMDIRTSDKIPMFSKPFEIVKDAALEHHRKYYSTIPLPT